MKCALKAQTYKRSQVVLKAQTYKRKINIYLSELTQNIVFYLDLNCTFKHFKKQLDSPDSQLSNEVYSTVSDRANYQNPHNFCGNLVIGIFC